MCLDPDREQAGRRCPKSLGTVPDFATDESRRPSELPLSSA